MDPNVWGEKCWFFLHTISLNFPDNPSMQDKKAYINYLQSLGNVLPCSVCKKHYTDYIKKHKPNVNSKSEFVRWVLNLHNDVNQRNNKEPWNYEDLLKKYYSEYSKQNNKNKSNKGVIILTLAIAVLVLLYFYKKKN